ncbi:winged helix DNA-binding protein [Streptomyces katrae]|uniref:winged helix DNA-binding protein n=1 Tax=Streptomyces katrae TaxID=68223 RepID=UPI003DAA1E1D
MTRRQNWTFLTNHARVLVTIARDPAARLRDVAQVCALTERTVQAIVADLETDGYLRRARDGRRNRYEISPGAMFRHPAEAGVQVAGLLALLTGAPPSGGAEGPAGAEAAAGVVDAGEAEGVAGADRAEGVAGADRAERVAGADAVAGAVGFEPEPGAVRGEEAWAASAAPPTPAAHH